MPHSRWRAAQASRVRRWSSVGCLSWELMCMIVVATAVKHRTRFARRQAGMKFSWMRFFRGRKILLRRRSATEEDQLDTTTPERARPCLKRSIKPSFSSRPYQGRTWRCTQLGTRHGGQRWGSFIFRANRRWTCDYEKRGRWQRAAIECVDH